MTYILQQFAFICAAGEFIHGVYHRGTGGTSPPEFGVGDVNANCPPQILSYRYKKERSVNFCGLHNTPKSVFDRGCAPDPAGELTALLQNP